MKTQTRIFWLLSQFSFTAGCSGYQVACYTKSEDPTGFFQEASEDCQLEPGDHVILALVDGERENGEVMYFSDQEIVLRPLGKSLQPRGYTSEQIQFIERDSTQLPAAAAIAIAGGILLVGSAVYLASEISDFKIGLNSK